MKISEVIRRNILDGLQLSDVVWHGRLDETEFLKRIFNLHELPSNDPRFRTMEGDIWQHRINNDDWNDDWIYSDNRLNLLGCDDDKFLQFLCEMIHPVVRNNPEEARYLLSIFNQQLNHDEFEIYEAGKIANQSVYSARSISSPIIVESLPRITSEFVKEQIQKCDDKLSQNDYDGAITNARSLVEGVLDDIHFKCIGERLPQTGDLLRDYKSVKGLLNLSDEIHSHDAIKNMMRGLTGIIHSIDFLSNKMGDRHRPMLRPQKHHAKLVVDCAKTVANFLFSTMEYQSARSAAFLNSLILVLDSDKRLMEIDQLLEDSEVFGLLSRSDKFLRTAAKNELIMDHSVSSYRQSDIFFAALSILLEELTADDIKRIYRETQENNQMIGWNGFVSTVREKRPELLVHLPDE